MPNVFGSDFNSQYFIRSSVRVVRGVYQRSCAWLAAIEPAVRRDEMQRNIPRIRFEIANAWKIEGHADQERFAIATEPHERQFSVVEAGAETQTMSVTIECDQRYDDDIETSRGNASSACRKCSVN